MVCAFHAMNVVIKTYVPVSDHPLAFQTMAAGFRPARSEAQAG